MVQLRAWINNLQELLFTVIHFYFGADLISVQAFLPKLNLYLNFATAGCSGASQPMTNRHRNFLRTETANFRFTENCTLPK